MADILSDVIAKRDLGGESVSIALGSEIPVIIGTSRGAKTAISTPESIVHSASHVDSLAHENIREVSWVNTQSNGQGRVFKEDVHFTLQESGTLDWSIAPALSPPAIDSITTSGSGGSFATTGEVAWAITCFDGDSNETTIGEYVTKTITSTSQSFSIRFAKPAGAVGAVRVYRTRTFSGGVPVFSSGDVVYFTTTNNNTFTDTGASGIAGNPPTSNSAKDRPAVGDTYYVQYSYAAFTYNTPKLYATTDAIINDHGYGSDLTNAGILAIGRNGLGNEAPAVVLVAVENDQVSDYQAALTALESYPYGNYIICLKQNDILDQSGKSHAENMSEDEVKKERFYVTCPAVGAAIGDESTPGTIIYKIKTFLGSKRVVVPVLEGSTYRLNQWQENDGSYTLSKNLTNSQFFAVAFAARKCSLDDPAEDLTGKQILGFSFQDIDPHWTKYQKEQVVNNGGSLVEDISTQAVVNRSVTCSTASLQDQNLSIISAEDELRRQVRNAGRPFLGKKITNARLSAFKSYVKQVLDILVQKEIITSYTDLETLQDSNNQQKMIARFRYKPQYSAIFIEFSYGFTVS